MKIYHEVVLFKTDRYLVILILRSIVCTLTLKTYLTRLFHFNIFVIYLFETLSLLHLLSHVVPCGLQVGNSGIDGDVCGVGALL